MNRLVKTIASLLLGIALVIAFWTLTSPAAKAREMSPVEMLQSQLPPNKTLKNASKADLNNAVCAAVKKNRKQAAQIVRAAIEARKGSAGDIVATALRCAGGPGNINCDMVADIVSEAVAGSASDAAAITEAAVTAAPDCREAIQRAVTAGGGGRSARPGGGVEGEGNFNNAPTNQNPPPGSVGGGGGGFDPQEGKCTVCHNQNNPHEIRIPCSQVPKYLSNHPGDYEGACRATPTVNR